MNNGKDGEGQLILAMIIKFLKDNNKVYGLNINPIKVS